jgi:hypothetical protein
MKQGRARTASFFRAGFLRPAAKTPVSRQLTGQHFQSLHGNGIFPAFGVRLGRRAEIPGRARENA